MATEKKALIVHRNTALAMRGLVEQPATAMMAETVAEGSYLFGFDPADVRNEAFVFAADGEATREPNQHYAETFLLYTWAVKKVVLAAEEGKEEVHHARLVLISPTGDTLAFVSVGALQSLDLIRALRGDGPYEPPLHLIVTESRTRHGFRVFKLRIIDDRTKADAKK